MDRAKPLFADGDGIGFELVRDDALRRKTLRVTPAMEAGLTVRVWDMEDIISAMDAVAPKPGKRGSYKKRNSN